jgi:hypothetical protein
MSLYDIELEGIDMEGNKDIFRIAMVRSLVDGPLYIKVEQVGVNLVGHSTVQEVEWYDSPNELPQWMQEQVAVLSVLDPAEKPAATIPGVGRRISEDVYWVYGPEEVKDEN